MASKFLILGLLTILILTPVVVTQVSAGGLSVRPGSLSIEGVLPGRLYELEIPLLIHNRSDRPYTYFLATCKPSEIGAKIPEGYLEIPDPGFLWLEPSKVVIQGDTIAEAKIHLYIPEREDYHNKAWVVLLEVRGRPEDNGMIALAAYPYVFIETAPRKE